MGWIRKMKRNAVNKGLNAHFRVWENFEVRY